MSWPEFLNPWTAIAASAITVPLLVLLYFLKLRRQQRVISSTLLWKKAIEDLQVNAPFQKLRRNLLLLLQLLLLALLGLALARPVTQAQSRAGELNAILIDRSASMSARDIEGRSRLEEAQRRALELVDSMRRGAGALVIAFDQAPQIIQPLTTDTAALRRAIESIRPTDCYSRLKLAFQLADAKLAFIPEQNRPATTPPEVWLFSDGKVLDSDEELSLRGTLKYVQLGAADSDNIGIVSMSAKRNFERPTEVEIFARLANFGPQPVTADVELLIDGKTARIASVSLPPQRWTDPKWKAEHAQEIPAGIEARNSVEFTIDLTDSAVLTLRQSHKDVLASDDIAQLVVPPARQLKVVLVTEGNYFLQKVLGTLSLKDVTVIRPLVYEAKPPEDADLVIFDRYSPRHLPPAGAFMYFAAVPPASAVRAVTRGEQFVLLPEPKVLDWRREHPVLRHMSLAKLYVEHMLKLEIPLDAQVMVDSTHGPMMVYYRQPQQTHLITSFDLLASDWPTRVSFPVFLNNAVTFLALSSQINVRESVVPGSSPILERALLERAGIKKEPLKLSGPINDVVPIELSGNAVLPPLTKVGLYRLTPSVPSADTFAVNLLSDRESDIVPSPLPPGRAGQVLAAPAGTSRVEWWWWLVAAAALPLLMIEWWVYTRRVHL